MAIHPRRVAGIIFIKIDGDQVSGRGDFEYRLSGLQNSAIPNADGTVAIGGQYLEGYIKGNISNYNETDHGDLKGLEGVTVTLELGNGKVIVAKDAFQVDESVGNVSEGQFTLHFCSENVEEVR